MEGGYVGSFSVASITTYVFQEAKAFQSVLSY